MSKPTAGIPKVIVPDAEHCGPAMRACTEPERAFVVAMLETGGSNQTLASKLAGIGGTNDAQRVAGSRLARIPRVQAAIREEADKRLRGGAVLAASVLIEIAGDVMHKDRFKASVELLNRAGLGVETVQRHIIEDHRTDNELRDAIIAMAKKNNLNPATLLGGPLDKVVDGEFSEVSADDVSFEGLEDLV